MANSNRRTPSKRTNKPNKAAGIRIGRYTVTPVGIALFAVLVILLVVIVVLLVSKLGGDRVVEVQATPEPTVYVTPEPTATPAPTPVPTPTPEPTPRVATIRSLGQIVLDQDILDSAKSGDSYDFTYMFADVAELIGSADLTVAQVEGVINDKKEPAFPAKKNKIFRVPGAIAKSLADLGVDVVNLGNNHSMDDDTKGVGNAINAVKAAGMQSIGTDTSNGGMPCIVNVNGIPVGLLSYTETVDAKLSSKVKKKIGTYAHLYSKSDIASDIRTMKIGGAAIIIAYVNWGNENSKDATDSQSQIARELAEAGVDIIIGTNPEIPQGIETIPLVNSEGGRKNVLVVNSLGSLLTGKTANLANTSIIFEFTIEETEYGQFTVKDLYYTPTLVYRYPNTAGVTGSSEGTVVTGTTSAIMYPAQPLPENGEGIVNLITESDTETAEDDMLDKIPADDEEGDDLDQIPADDEEDDTLDQIPADDEEGDDLEGIPTDDEEGAEGDTAEDTVKDVRTGSFVGPTDSSAPYVYRILNLGDWMQETEDLALAPGMTEESLTELRKTFSNIQRIFGVNIAKSGEYR